MTAALTSELPPVRGMLRRDVALGPLTWFRVGGPADIMFQPADLADLQGFLARLPRDVPVTVIGAASNLIVRDGGIRGVVIRLGGALARVEVEGQTVIAGAGALDTRIAATAQRASLAGLEFYSGIPGTIGGAVRMNAGAFGGETAQRLLWAEVVDRGGELQRLATEELGLGYRHSTLADDLLLVRAAFAAAPGDPSAIARAMWNIKMERETSQPLRVATGGSTFKNPAGKHAWELIDQAGCRGLVHGGAMVSEKHCNFLINIGRATAGEIEELGELVRTKVRQMHAVELEWEIRRVGQAERLAA